MARPVVQLDVLDFDAIAQKGRSARGQGLETGSPVDDKKIEKPVDSSCSRSLSRESRRARQEERQSSKQIALADPVGCDALLAAVGARAETRRPHR